MMMPFSPVGKTVNPPKQGVNLPLLPDKAGGCAS